MGKDFDDLADKAKRIAAEAGLADKFSSLKDLENLDGLKEAAGEMAEGAAVFVRKYPVQSVLGALAAGVVLGALLGRKN
jgi:ElaB/YqjD/DUF883 family membrane-anchored ribosome-binding protein